MSAGPWIMRLALILAFASALALLGLSNSSLTRAAILSHSKSCQLQLQTGLSEATRIAIIGSSRTREAIDPGVMTKALGLDPETIVNLSHPQIGPGYDYGVISALSRQKDLDLVVMEVIARSDALRAAEREIDPAPDLIAAELAMGSVRESYILGASLQDQARRAMRDAPNLSLGVSDFFSLMSRRITTTIALVKTRQIYPRLYRAEGRIDPEREMMCAIRSSRDDSLISDAQRAIQTRKIAGYRDRFANEDWEDPAPLGYLSEDAFAFDRGTLRDMIDLGERWGFRLVFLYVPGIHVPVDPALGQAFTDAFTAPLVIPPQGLRAKLAQSGYYDNVHLNETGGDLLVQWLAGVFASEGWVSAR